MSGAANRTTVLSDHGKHDSIAEVTGFLKLELQFLVRAKPVLKEAANGRPPLEAVPRHPPIQDRTRSEVARHAVEITAIRSLKLPADKLQRVGVVASSDMAGSVPHDDGREFAKPSEPYLPRPLP